MFLTLAIPGELVDSYKSTAYYSNKYITGREADPKNTLPDEIPAKIWINKIWMNKIVYGEMKINWNSDRFSAVRLYKMIHFRSAQILYNMRNLRK